MISSGIPAFVWQRHGAEVIAARLLALTMRATLSSLPWMTSFTDFVTTTAVAEESNPDSSDESPCDCSYFMKPVKTKNIQVKRFLSLD